MSFLLSSCKELSFNELVSLNGGCTPIQYSKFATSIDALIKNTVSGTPTYNNGPVTQMTSVVSSLSVGGNQCTVNRNGYLKIVESIKNNRTQQYLITGNKDTEYRCDQWVQEVLTDAGYDAEKFLNGTAKETVAEHISKLKEGTYSTSVPKEQGAYVVFMADGTIGGKAVTEHCGILLVGANGQMQLWDNSSGNNVDRVMGGVQYTYNGGVDYTNVSAVNSSKISDFCYDKYYFQTIK